MEKERKLGTPFLSESTTVAQMAYKRPNKLKEKRKNLNLVNFCLKGGQKFKDIRFLKRIKIDSLKGRCMKLAELYNYKS
jgi:hypothetical protein